MFRKNTFLLFLSLLAGVFFSCTDSALTVTPETVLIDANGNGQYVTVDAPGDWSAVTSADWVQLGMKAGNGKNSVYVYAHATTASRSAVVTFTCMDQKTMVSVTQAGPGGEQGGGGSEGGQGGQGGTTPTGTSYVDVLNAGFTGITKNQYDDWSGKMGSASCAVYAGRTCKSTEGAIQMTAKNSVCGIISTTSGGAVAKITLVWNSKSGDVGNTAARAVQVYGSNTAYSSPANLYSSSTQGTLIGTITYGQGTELTVSGNYAYVGLRSKENALYLDEIKITWVK